MSQDFSIIIGNDYLTTDGMEFTFTVDESAASGTFYAYNKDGSVIATNSITVLSATSVSLDLSHTFTSAFTSGQYRFEIVLTLAGGSQYSVIGNVTAIAVKDFGNGYCSNKFTGFNNWYSQEVDIFGFTPGTCQTIYAADHQTDNEGPTWDNAPPYTRNTNRMLPDIDLTGVFGKIFGQSGNAYCGSICVGTHTILSANHAAPSTFNAVDEDGTMTALTSASQLQVGSTDIKVIKTNEAIPATIKRFKLLPSTYATKISFGLKYPTVVYVRRDQRLYISNWTTKGTSSSEGVVLSTGDVAGYSGWNFNGLLVGGDSGCPVGLIINDEFVPIFLWHFAGGSGPNLAENLTAIQSAMDTLNTGDTLQTVDIDDVGSTTINPLETNGGTVHLIKGNDFVISPNTALVFSGTYPYTITGSSVHWKLYDRLGNTLLNITGVVINTSTIKVEIPYTSSVLIEGGVYRYELNIVLSNTHIESILGDCVVTSQSQEI